MKIVILLLLILALTGPFVEAEKKKKKSKKGKKYASNVSGGLSQSTILNSLGFDNNTKETKSSKGNSGKANKSILSIFGSNKSKKSSSTSIGGGAAILSGGNVPSPLDGSNGALGSFEWEFNSAFSEMARTPLK
jgi:hypothetical protein